MTIQSMRAENGCLPTAALKELLQLPAPQRKLPKVRKCGIQTSFASWKMGEMLYSESLNEHKAMTILEADPDVLGFCAQPKRFEYEVDGKKRRYCNDILYVKRSGERVYQELKEDDESKDNPRMAEKCLAAETQCREMGCTYEVKTKADLERGHRLENSRLILKDRVVIVSDADRGVIQRALYQKPLSVDQIAALLGDRVEIAFQKVRSVAAWGHVRFDMDQRLTNETKFHLPN